MDKRGYIQVYTGSGKNKTTSAFGLTFRGIGKGWNVLIVQFLKGDEATSYGEIEACKKFSDQVTILQSHNTRKIIMEHNKTKEDIELTKLAWSKMSLELIQGKKRILSYGMDECGKTLNGIEYKPYDMLVLDEILPTLNLGLITQKTFFDFIKEIKEERPDLEIVLTGRMWAEPLYDKIKNISDLFTDGRCVKHYFKKHCTTCKREFEFRSNYCANCGMELTVVDSREGIEY